jgi:hypothetical protein
MTSAVAIRRDLTVHPERGWLASSTGRLFADAVDTPSSGWMTRLKSDDLFVTAKSARSVAEASLLQD